MTVARHPNVIDHRSVGPKPYIRTHNAMRGIAAIGVFCYHLQLEKTYQVPLGFAAPLVHRGYIWVDLFFILSGFVLSLTYQEALSQPSTASLRAFFTARIARILPLHLVALGYLAALEIGVNILSWGMDRAPHLGPITPHRYEHLGLQAALVQIWDGAATLDWNIPSWSISAEMHVYLVFPLIAVALYKAPRLASAALLLLAAAIYGAIHVHYGSLDILTPLAVLRCLAGFTLGVLIQRQRGAAEHFPNAVLSVMQFGAAAAIGALLLLSPVYDVWVIGPFALLVWATCTDRGVICRALDRTVFQRLGDTSYSIYLLNFPVLVTAGIVWPRVARMMGSASSTETKLLWMAILTVGIITLAIYSFACVEKPLRRWLAGQLSPWSPVRLPSRTEPRREL